MSDNNYPKTLGDEPYLLFTFPEEQEEAPHLYAQGIDMSKAPTILRIVADLLERRTKSEDN